MEFGLTDAMLAAIVGLVGGILLGLAARLGRFCTLGAIEDALYGKNETRLRMWGTAIGTAIIGTFALVGTGNLDLSSTFYIANPFSPVAGVLGGVLFGYGMAMAGTCGFGALARFGGGDLRAFVTVVVMGITAYATLSGPLAGLRDWLLDNTSILIGAQGYADALARLLAVPAWSTGMLIGAAILTVTLWSRSFLSQPVSIFWGAVVGLAIVLGWAGMQWIATNGMGGTEVVSHAFSAPVGQSLIYVMTSSAGGLTFGVGSVSGVVLGSILGSLIKGHFRWEACDDPRELKRIILGAMLMGVGAVLALGCTIGQGLSAFSVLAFSAPLVLAGIFAGVSLGLRQLIFGQLAFR